MPNQPKQISKCCGAEVWKRPGNSINWYCKKCEQPCEITPRVEEGKSYWEKRIDYNAHDMGEMGKFIRVDYAKDIIRDSNFCEVAQARAEEKARIVSVLEGLKRKPTKTLGGEPEEPDAFKCEDCGVVFFFKDIPCECERFNNSLLEAIKKINE